MSPDDAALIERLAIQASVNPTRITRADLVRLMKLARVDHRDPAWRDILAGDDPMLVHPKAVRLMIKMARQPRR